MSIEDRLTEAAAYFERLSVHPKAREHALWLMALVRRQREALRAVQDWYAEPISAVSRHSLQCRQHDKHCTCHVAKVQTALEDSDE